NRGDLRVFQAAEVAKLHHLRLARVKPGQFLQGRVEVDEVKRAGRLSGEVVDVGKVNVRPAIAALAGILGPRKIDENLPHETSGDGKEMRSAGPLHGRAANEADESFVDQS